MDEKHVSSHVFSGTDLGTSSDVIILLDRSCIIHDCSTERRVPGV